MAVMTDEEIEIGVRLQFKSMILYYNIGYPVWSKFHEEFSHEIYQNADTKIIGRIHIDENIMVLQKAQCGDELWLKIIVFGKDVVGWILCLAKYFDRV